MTSDSRLLEHLRGFDTPTICNALEIVMPERRGHGYTTRPFVCALPHLRPICGFARTATIRAVQPASLSPAEAKALRLRYYEYIAAEPRPTVVVIQDLDPEPGYGAFWGEVNTAIHQGLGCLGCVTNGSIRDLDAIAPDFQLLAGSVGPSHAFVHVEAFGIDVNVHGMAVRHGDIIHADRHGAVVIPEAALARLPDALDLCRRREAPILAAARSSDFDIDRLRQALAAAEEIH